MRVRHEISEEPWFYKRTQHVHSCGQCSEHNFVIIQKIGVFYVMHSSINTQGMRLWHRWDARANDPACLSDFERIKPVPGWKPALSLKKKLMAKKLSIPDDVPPAPNIDPDWAVFNQYFANKKMNTVFYSDATLNVTPDDHNFYTDEEPDPSA